MRVHAQYEGVNFINYHEVNVIFLSDKLTTQVQIAQFQFQKSN